jgi:hypothetical protein
MEPSVIRTQRHGDAWGVWRGSERDLGYAVCLCRGDHAERNAKRIARLLELAAAWDDEAVLTRADVVLREAV